MVKKEVDEKVTRQPAVEAVVAEDVKTEETAVAKAGKRSKKAIAEVEAKEIKEVKKASKSDAAKKPAKAAPKPRTRLERASKKYREVAKLIETDKTYNLAEALELAVKTSTTKFDSTVEIHVNLNVDPKQSDQNVRDSVSLPSGTGKTVRIAAFVEHDDEAKAEQAGADIAGADKIIELLDKEQIDFDIMVATPALMAKLGKYARLLGPRGLMPSPKSGTVTADIETAIKEAKKGKVEYRVDQAGIIHLGIGKVSFGKDKLLANAEAVVKSIKNAKPSSVKSGYVMNFNVTTTMGPAIKVDPSSLN